MSENAWKNTKVGPSIEVLKKSCELKNSVQFEDKETDLDIWFFIESVIPIDRPGIIRHKITGKLVIQKKQIEMYYTSPENIGLYCIKD